jgi:hypothetical protein
MNKITQTPKRLITLHPPILRRSSSPTLARFLALVEEIEADRDYWHVCGGY